jgi:hypothetical protein
MWKRAPVITLVVIMMERQDERAAGYLDHDAPSESEV